MSDNNVTLIGNLTRDPELKYTANGQARAVFGIAVNRRYQVNGEWKDDTSFFNCVAWRDLAENLAESVSKGQRVMVAGRLDQRSWDTPEGEKRSVVEVTVDDVGVSLRWATASPTRNVRDAAGGGASQAAAQAPVVEDEPF